MSIPHRPLYSCRQNNFWHDFHADYTRYILYFDHSTHDWNTSTVWITEKEEKIYLAWLELGSAPASSIARQANEIRSTVYSILKEFKKQGIVQEIKRKEISYFSVISPEMLLRKLEDKYTTFKENFLNLWCLQRNSATNRKYSFLKE